MRIYKSKNKSNYEDFDTQQELFDFIKEQKKYGLFVLIENDFVGIQQMYDTRVHFDIKGKKLVATIYPKQNSISYSIKIKKYDGELNIDFSKIVLPDKTKKREIDFEYWFKNFNYGATASGFMVGQSILSAESCIMKNKVVPHMIKTWLADYKTILSDFSKELPYPESGSFLYYIASNCGN